MPLIPSDYSRLVRENRNFRMLWFGQIASLVGDWFNLIASAALVASLTRSGLAVGGLFLVRMMAPFLMSPFGGVWSDRYNRKYLLIMTDIVRAVVMIGFLFVRDTGDIWLLYTLTALQLGFSGVFYPARNAVLPDIVKPADVGTANTLSAATWSTMLAIGAALGGLSTGLFGIYPSFVIDGLTFLVSAFFISRMVYEPKSTPTDGKGAAIFFRQYVRGLQYMKKKIDILYISLVKAAMFITAGGAVHVIEVIIAREIFVYGQEGGISLGLMYMVFGIGSGISPLVARQITGDRDRPMRLAISVGYGIQILAMVLLSTIHSLPVVLLAILIFSTGNGLNWVFSTQLLLQRTDKAVRGRIFSTEMAFFTLANGLGAAYGGWLYDHTSLGIPGLCLVLAGFLVVPFVFWTLWTRKMTRAERLLHNNHVT